MQGSAAARPVLRASLAHSLSTVAGSSSRRSFVTVGKAAPIRRAPFQLQSTQERLVAERSLVSSFRASAAPITRPFASSAPQQQASTEPAQKACWKCGAHNVLDSLSCSKCGALQPLPSELDAYQLLGLRLGDIGSNGWDVDLGELKALWRKRVALSHPDRMGSKDEKERQIAEQQSSMINKAYETLRDPLQRAHLLLEKHASSAPSEAESLEDLEVLMEVMELREGLEEAKTEDDAEGVRAQNRARLDSTIDVLRDAFAKNPPDVDTARSAAVGLRYWSNIENAAREWQPGKRVELKH